MDLNNHARQRGFTVLELAIVLIVSSLLLVPLLKITFSAVGGNRDQKTAAAFEKAVDALIAYAAEVDPVTLKPRNGCLPFAADFEGGLPDTDQAGNPLADTGVGKAGQRAGDLPWADLGLVENTRGGFFRDGDFLRIQYYVAFVYAGADCGAGFRGLEWNPQIGYVGSPAAPVYVYVSAKQSPKLYKITGTLAAGVHPKNASVAEDVTLKLKKDLLRVRRGPDITSAVGGQKDDISKQNVFVLIAVGDNRNAVLGRQYMRDANHVINKDGTSWALGVSKIDDAVFAMTPDLTATDRLDDGDDTIRVMSFVEYKSRLEAFGIILQPVCEDQVPARPCAE